MATSPTSGSTSESKRIELLDGWRTLAVLCMVVWHALWDLGLVGLFPIGLCTRMPLQLLRAAAVHSFIFLAGVSCRFSHSNARRGVKLLLCAAGLSLVMAFVDPVRFGILHLLGCCSLLWAAGERLLKKLPAWSALVCLALFAALRLPLDALRVGTPWLWWLGLRTETFYSADYYPLLPWGLLFFAGAFLGGRLRAARGAWRSLRLPAALTFPGRHALAIYLIHQPLLYGAAWLLARLLGAGSA